MEMSSLSPFFRPLLPQWSFLVILNSNPKISLKPCVFSSSSSSSSYNNDSVPLPKQSQTQLGYDPSEELFGLSPVPKPSFYMLIILLYNAVPFQNQDPGSVPMDNTSESFLVQVAGGEVILHVPSAVSKDQDQIVPNVMESSPLRVKEDDEVDNLDLKLDVKKKSKRVYQSPSPEVGLKISRSLKSLNAKTGLFSKRMKIIHRDPMLQAQRVAAIKKAKGTAAARKRVSEALKDFFSDPENRHKRSVSMKGVKFYCRNCGREGHRRHYCPEIRDSSIDKRFKCRVCGEKGHNRRTCPRSMLSNEGRSSRRRHRCKVCRKSGHNRRTCPQVIGVRDILTAGSRIYTCKLCRKEGHNARTCPGSS
ncbi:DNA-binding protein HEXBP [Gossypium arboreum]|uniref:DNA-binding protein HEXBP n=1 Tax=Gossypium arboreum TaxID=29729 RepID=A0A0B0P0J8_GOSAR|nr:DNA-binding protein HEXBP [Gossypium arboreum]